ncbi:PAS domain S-box protein [Mycoplasmatota bacterium WC44]
MKINDAEILYIDNVNKKFESLNQKYRHVFNNTGTAMVIENDDGTIIEVNKEYEALTGYTRQELISGFNYESLLHPDDVDFITSYHKMRREGDLKIPDSYESRIVDKYNNVKNIYINVKAIPSSNIRVVSLIDITDHIRKENTLKEYNERYKSLFKDSKSIMLLVNPKSGEIVDANDEAVDFYGYSKDELLNKNISEITITDDLFEQMKEATDELKKDFTFKHKLSNGEIRDVEVRSGQITIKSQKILYSIIHDVTEKKNIEKQIEHRLNLENIITEVSQTLNNNIAQPKFDKIIEKITSVIKADKGLLLRIKDDNIEESYLYEDENDNSMGKTIQKIEKKAQKYLKGFLRYNKEITYDDIFEFDEKFINDIKVFEDLGINSIIGLPIVSARYGTLGTLSFFSKDSAREWSSDDVRFLRIMRDMISNYWISEDNHSQIENSYKKQSIILDSIVESLSSIVEVRDPYTFGHQKRVSKLAIAIGKELGLSNESIISIKIASLLHDIGKIKLPIELLTKPSKLSVNEFNLIKEHPQVGFDILREIPFDLPISEIVLQHHEKLDGSGYPYGLKGNETLLESKIITVADVVEAMASHRPYRPALGLYAALDEITMHKGIKYGSNVVDACIKVFKEKKFKFE